MAKETSDTLQQYLVDYATELSYERLEADVVHAAKVRIIDALGVLMAGLFEEPIVLARRLATLAHDDNSATLIGTRTRTAVDMAAFVNTAAIGHSGMTDSYQMPGADNGHPEELVGALLPVAEFNKNNGREFINAVVLGYEIFLAISDSFRNPGFDQTNFGCIATAVGAGKLLGFTSDQLAQCIALAAVPNNILRQVKRDHISMYKGVSAGHAARAGVFAALLARAGMEGPHQPFEGKAGWCDHIARHRFSLDALGMGGRGRGFRILQTLIKTRPADGKTISCILAAEKISPLNIDQVEKVCVETYKKAREAGAIGERHLSPRSRQDADQSIYYLVAVTLMDGTVTSRSFNDNHLQNPKLHTLMRKIEVVENEEYTRAYNAKPVRHRTRVTVTLRDNERRVGESNDDPDNLSSPKSDQQIESKFRTMAEEMLGASRTKSILERLWRLDEIANMAEVPPHFTVI